MNSLSKDKEVWNERVWNLITQVRVDLGEQLEGSLIIRYVWEMFGSHWYVNAGGVYWMSLDLDL